MEACSSPWHNLKSCRERYERCNRGYCVIDDGFIILISLFVVILCLAVSAIFAFVPKLRGHDKASYVLLGISFFFCAVSLAICIAGILLTYI